MASIGSILPTNTTSATDNSAKASSASSTATDPLANESTFLQLLVSQLKNQDPSSPMDGTTFVTQLAQFSDLEQNLAMRQDLDSLSSRYAGTSSVTAAGASATEGNPSTTQSGSNGGASNTGTPVSGSTQTQS